MNRDKLAVKIMEELDRAYKDVGSAQAFAVVANKLADIEARIDALESAARGYYVAQPGRTGH